VARDELATECAEVPRGGRRWWGRGDAGDTADEAGVGCGRPGARGGVAQRAEAGCFVSAVGVQQAADADVVFELGAGEAFVASGASS